MPEGLFGWLGGLVEGSFGAALAGSFLWGVLSVLLSPCHLAGIPLVVGYIAKQQRGSAYGGFRISSVFSLGVLASIAAIGLITAAMGRMLGDTGRWGNWLAAGVFLAVGLYLLELFHVNLPGAHLAKRDHKGLWGALLLGLAFGAVLGPCTFAFMAPVLAITLFAEGTGFFSDFLLLSLYGAGHCLVIVLAGTFSGGLKKYLKWNETSRGLTVIKKICGVLLIGGAVYFAAFA